VGVLFVSSLGGRKGDRRSTSSGEGKRKKDQGRSTQLPPTPPPRGERGRKVPPSKRQISGLEHNVIFGSS